MSKIERDVLIYHRVTKDGEKQAAIARELGISRQAVHSIIKAQETRIAKLNKLADVCNLYVLGKQPKEICAIMHMKLPAVKRILKDALLWTPRPIRKAV